MHTSISGVADHMAESDEHALQILRQIVLHLGKSTDSPIKVKALEQPHYDPNEIIGIVPKDPKKAFDIRGAYRSLRSTVPSYLSLSLTMAPHLWLDLHISKAYLLVS